MWSRQDIRLWPEAHFADIGSASLPGLIPQSSPLPRKRGAIARGYAHNQSVAAQQLVSQSVAVCQKYVAVLCRSL